MSHQNLERNHLAVTRVLIALLLGAAVVLLSSCKTPDSDEGVVTSDGIQLPTDTLLNLACANAGIYLETCVLDDPENPFLNTAIIEFDVNNSEAFNKFELADGIPAGRSGAKARFYFWATALARRPIGENQYYTARALHELFNYNSDPLIQAQALKAYRSVLDNFFGSAVFFACYFRDGVFRGCPPPDLDPARDQPAAFAVPLNELTVDALYRVGATGFARLVASENCNPTDEGCLQLFVLDLLASWGYAYQPATPPAFDNGVVSVTDG